MFPFPPACLSNLLSHHCCCFLCLHPEDRILCYTLVCCISLPFHLCDSGLPCHQNVTKACSLLKLCHSLWKIFTQVFCGNFVHFQALIEMFPCVFFVFLKLVFLQKILILNQWCFNVRDWIEMVITMCLCK